MRCPFLADARHCFSRAEGAEEQRTFLLPAVPLTRPAVPCSEVWPLQLCWWQRVHRRGRKSFREPWS